MAKASWATVAPMSGTGSADIKVSATANTGRSNRTTTVTVTNQNGTKPVKTVSVSQAGKADYLSLSSATPEAIAATGGKLTITIKSNSKLVYLYYEMERFPISPSNVTAKINNVVQTVTDDVNAYMVAITPTNDPGNTAEYTMIVEVTVPANTSAVDRNLRFRIGNEAGASDMNELNYQLAAASTVALDKTSVTIPQPGTAQTVKVTSNDSWAIS